MAPPSPGRAPRAWTLAWALLGVLLASVIARGPLEARPHVEDEVVYQLQADRLAEGRLWEEARLPRAAHVYPFVVNEAPSAAFPAGRRFGVFPQGWPLILALGTVLGLPWLVNPLLHGGLVLAGTSLARREAGDGAARLAAPLLAFSPALLLQAASRLSHPLCALLAVLGFLLLPPAGVRPGPARAAGLGAVLGLLLLTRPVDALVVGGLLGALALHRLRARPAALLGWAPTVAGVALALGLVLAQNHLLVGDALRFTQDAWFEAGEPPFPSPAFRHAPGCNDLGFGPDRGCEPTFGSLGHDPAKAGRGLLHNATLAARTWLGAPPALLLALIPLAVAGRRALAARALALWGALALAYAAYWYAGPCLGARFHHAAAPLVLVAAAQGAALVLERLRAPGRLGLVVLALPLWRLSAALPELPGYWGVDGRMDALEARWDQGPALMLVAYGAPYASPTALPQTVGGEMVGTAIQRRGLWIERRGGPLVYAEYQPALVEATRARHPGLPAWILVLRADPARDEVLPLPPLEVAQVEDLPLPVNPVAWD